MSASGARRFGVRYLGAVTLVLPSHPINNRLIRDWYYDPRGWIAELARGFRVVH